ncbi:hypothetical protein [Amorphus sp. MBR-141]
MSDIFRPEAWTLTHPEDVLKFFDFDDTATDASERRGGMLVFRKHLSPLDMYKYLCGRFGKPNGMQTFLKNKKDSNNLVHWDFLINAGKNNIWIQGGNRDIHVAIKNRRMTPKDWVKFASNIKNDFRRCRTHSQSVQSRLEKWNILSNRFSLISNACAEYHANIVDNIEPPSFVPPRRRTEKDIRKYVNHVERISKRSEKIFNSCLSLDLITPIFIESYINLVIFILRKKELKDNARHYDSFTRQPIDTRVFDLHLKCDHFKSGVDSGTEEYKNFKRIFDRRNYIIHGNIDPVKDCIESIYFDGFTPLFKDGGDPVLEMFKKKEKIYDASGVLERYYYAHEFIHYINKLLSDPARAIMEIFTSESEFGYDVSRQRPGKLLPGYEAMMLLPLKYDDELNVDWK